MFNTSLNWHFSENEIFHGDEKDLFFRHSSLVTNRQSGIMKYHWGIITSPTQFLKCENTIYFLFEGICYLQLRKCWAMMWPETFITETEKFLFHFSLDNKTQAPCILRRIWFWMEMTSKLYVQKDMLVWISLSNLFWNTNDACSTIFLRLTSKINMMTEKVNIMSWFWA